MGESGLYLGGASLPDSCLQPWQATKGFGNIVGLSEPGSTSTRDIRSNSTEPNAPANNVDNTVVGNYGPSHQHVSTRITMYTSNGVWFIPEYYVEDLVNHCTLCTSLNQILFSSQLHTVFQRLYFGVDDTKSGSSRDDGDWHHMSFLFEDFKTQYVHGYWEVFTPYSTQEIKEQNVEKIHKFRCTEGLAPPVQVRILEK
ncbi:hypothetical protein Tco_0262009 [Tanacetum coccineum]